MAKLNGLKALFTTKQIENVLDQRRKEYDERAINVLAYQGEQFINRARTISTYIDRTGNLRSSIGYLILRDGQVVTRNFAGSSKANTIEGKSVGLAYANEIAQLYPKGYVLIGVAGMRYAAYVETKGYDVITGSVPSDNEFKKLLSAIKF
jgi:hypothetical protein